MENEAAPKPVVDNLGINSDGRDQKSIADAVGKSLDCNAFYCKSCGEFFKTAVFAVTGKGTVCETCLKANDWHGVHLELYSVMLKNLSLVPCLYADQGCKSKVHELPEAAELHLKDCKYRPVKCAAPECPWQNKLVDLAEHFKEAHQDDVVNDESAVKLDLALDSFFAVKLLVRENADFVFFIKRDQGSNDIMYRILNANNNDVHCAYIKHSYCEGSDTFNVQIDTQKLNVIDRAGEPVWKKVSLSILNAIFVGKNILSIVVNVDELSKTEKLLLCSGCRQIMRPPIYQCENDHGICSSCRRSELDQCKVCQKTCNTRHLSLEALTSSVLYPCTYREVGCNARICLEEVSQHEAYCRFGFYICPLPGCRDYKNYNTLPLFRQHLKNVHLEQSKDLTFNTLYYEAPKSLLYKKSSYIYIDDDCCFEIQHEVQYKPNQVQLTSSKIRGAYYSVTCKLLNKDSLKSTYLCDIRIKKGINNDIEFSENKLVSKETLSVSFRHNFNKDSVDRSLSVTFTKLNT